MPNFLSLNFQDKHTPEHNSSLVGQKGEELAARFLVKNGFQLVLANFKVPIGRNRKGVQISGEIDLIAIESDTVCFIEVKTRSSDEYASPLSAVNLRKQRQIIRAARAYRKIFNLRGAKYRYDVISIILNKKDERFSKIELFRNFWNENKFRKTTWNDDFFY